MLCIHYCLPDPCAVNNGACSFLCLLSAIESAGYSCIDPDDADTTETGRAYTIL